MHDVYLNLKDSISESDLAKVIGELKRLEQVPSAHNLYVGTRAETGDTRLDPNYDLALHVEFTTEKNLESYAVDSLHLEVRSNLKDFLAVPPVVFDYWTE